jgi:hypothetical protein
MKVPFFLAIGPVVLRSAELSARSLIASSSIGVRAGFPSRSRFSIASWPPASRLSDSLPMFFIRPRMPIPDDAEAKSP